ncbi:MAG: hypothetical protein ACRDGQ_11495, partial [Candidatus Limnocylindrales bacterium]
PPDLHRVKTCDEIDRSVVNALHGVQDNNGVRVRSVESLQPVQARDGVAFLEACASSVICTGCKPDPGDRCSADSRPAGQESRQLWEGLGARLWLEESTELGSAIASDSCNSFVPA